MSPKFKGTKEEYLREKFLDDEKHSRRGQVKKKQVDRPDAKFLDPALSNGTVVEVFHKQAKVRLDTGTETLLTYRMAALMRQNEEGTRDRAPLTVGDRVVTDPKGTIEGVCERRNVIRRPAPGREGVVQTIAANVDLVVIVSSVSMPEFSSGVVDRFLVMTQQADIPSLLVLNKSDLLEQGDARAEYAWNVYREIGVTTTEVSAKTGQGLAALLERLAGKTVTFLGHSGVGKTSLLRAILGREVGKIGSVNEFTGKGKHTTSSAMAYQGPQGSLIIDTPGVREFSLFGVTRESLLSYFPELFEAAQGCPLGCTHETQGEGQDCRLTTLPRLQNYLKIIDTL